MVKLRLQKSIILGGKEKMDKIKSCLQCGREVSQIDSSCPSCGNITNDKVIAKNSNGGGYETQEKYKKGKGI